MADERVNVKQALELINSAAIKTRTKGLADLKYIFRYNDQSSRLAELHGDDYPLIFEALFKCAEVERTIYLKLAKGTSKKASNDRQLRDTASALRVVVEAGLKKIDIKTVKALIEHITDTLPLPQPDQKHCEPLVDEYAKTLRLVLGDQVHVEHLKADKWAETLEFCLCAITLHADAIDPAKSIISNGQSSYATQPASGQPGRSFSQSINRGAVPSNPATEFVICVRRLVQAPNASFEMFAGAILDAMLSYLSASTTVGRGHHDAFAAINYVYSRIRTSRLELTAGFIQRILPIIRELWSSKRSSIREELLTWLLLVEEHLHSLVKRPNQSQLRDEVERLTESLLSEYLKRHDKDMVHAEDLLLQRPSSCMSKETRPSTASFVLRRARSESAWMTVHIIASLSYVLDGESSPSSNDTLDNGHDIDGPNKRCRTARRFDDYVRQLAHPSTMVRLAVLQVLTFMLDKIHLNGDELLHTVERLAAQLGDASQIVTSWASIALACCTSQKAAAAAKFRDQWLQLWHVVARNLPNINSSRCASHLLDTLLTSRLVSFAAVFANVDAIMRSAELNGPSGLSEASLRLWANLMRLRQAENPSSSAMIGEQSIRWLFTCWTPSQLMNKGKLSAEMAVLEPNDLVAMLFACLGMSPPEPSRALVSVLGPLSRARVKVAEEHCASQYLLMSEATLFQQDLALETTAQPSIEGQQRQAWQSHTLLLDRLLTESNNLISSWTELVTERPSAATPDIIRNCLMFCLVVSRLLAGQAGRSIPRAEVIRKVTDALGRRVTSLLSRTDCSQDRLDAAFIVFNEVLPHPDSISHVRSEVFVERGLVPLGLHLHSSLNERRSMKGASIHLDSYDSMELDDDFDSQTSRLNTLTQFSDTVRDDIGARSDIEALRACVAAYLSMTTTTVEASTIDDDTGLVPSKFIWHLCEIPDSDMYACRPLIDAITRSTLRFQSSDAIALLEHLASIFLQEYDFERCEHAILLCLEVVEGFAAHWTQPEVDKQKIGDQIFEWAMKNILKPGIASSRVQISFAHVCYRLAQLQYPLARTTIFDLFSIGDCIVKFHVSSLIAEVLTRWKLAEHDYAFETFRKEHLPSDLTRTEEIAMRLFVVAKLGARWPTLRRKCVYTIYETAAAMQAEQREYATLCIRSVALSLGLGSSTAFFQLFAPQLLYTWLGADSLAAAPYEIFGYPNLDALIKDVEHEVIAQLLMRRREAELEKLSTSLGKSTAQLLKHSFSRCCAYAMSWDLLHPPRDSTHQNSETLLYKLVGPEVYSALVSRHLHEIAAIVICATSDVEQAGKTLDKKKNYAAQSKRLKEITESCASSLTLPAQQQPSFPVKTLTDVLERLCRRGALNITELWSPSRLTYCLRMLLHHMLPAHGSLFACACIRKLRLVIALAGETALEGYPLEMAIHGLKFYINDQYCADDAMGIVQYLYHRGRSYLREHPAFVAGSAAATLLSARFFLGTIQDSTTQDSQFNSTRQKAEGFHTWFETYLNEFASLLQETQHRRRFRSLIQNAAKSKAQGSAHAGTAEGKLLLDLLIDGDTKSSSLLDATSRLALFDMIQQQFHPVPPTTHDIISSDKHAQDFSNQLWALIDRPGVHDNFRTWAARSLGRAFSAASGSRKFQRDLTEEGEPHQSRIESSLEVADPVQHCIMVSRATVILLIKDVTRSTCPQEVAASEEALRMIIERAMKDDETRHCIEVALENEVQIALHVPERGIVRTPTQHKAIREVGPAEPQLSADSWIMDLTIALASTSPKDSILGPVAYFIRTVGRMARPIFPYVLHLALVVEFGFERRTAEQMAEVCRSLFLNEDRSSREQTKILLKGILYLRKQPVPHEQTFTDRDAWLELNYLEAAGAAASCSMYTTALQLAETHMPLTAKSSRRSPDLIEGTLSDEMLVEIYRNLDDPDSFYGAPQEEGLRSLMDRLDFEQDGYKGLLLRGARLDSQIRRTGQAHTSDVRGIVHSLMNLNLSSLAHTTMSSAQMGNAGADMMVESLDAARKLEQWDVKAPASYHGSSGVVFEAFQSVQGATSGAHVNTAVQASYLKAMHLASKTAAFAPLSDSLVALASLAEMDAVLSAKSGEALQDVYEVLSSRHQEVRQTRYATLQPILSSRQTLFSTLSRSENLQRLMNATPKDAASFEIRNLLSSCATAEKHGADNELLTAATYLHDLVPSCRGKGLLIQARADFEVAQVLWHKDEQHASVRMLRHLVTDVDFQNEALAPGLSTVYAALGTQVAAARLEKPKEIIDNYLRRAVDELHGQTTGSDPGEVFHAFASFCDRQLHYSESREEFIRVERLRKERLEEMELLKEQTKASASRSEKHRLGRSLDALKRWVALDEAEYQRLRTEREALIELSIENLLRSLHASDLHNDDILRFVSLWLEFSDLTLANDTANKHIKEVASYKFTAVMNQLSSRLQVQRSPFQNILSNLVFRICTEHPYHGMYQIFSGANPVGIRDEASKSRQEASLQLSYRLKKSQKAGRYWTRIYDANAIYNDATPVNREYNSGDEYKLDDVSVTKAIIRTIPKLRVAPITLHVDVRSDGDYGALPTVHHFKPTFKIAGGLSKPKIIVAIGSDGRSYRHILKGGSDDLRQDAIMEQVFEQVSTFLKRHPATRQRDLAIRTYKVIPLSANSGVIEFVPSTLPLNDVLIPMHKKYYPKDLRTDTVRKQIDGAKGDDKEAQIKVFKGLIAKFNPAMRFWFLETFPDPDEWYQRRLAYTRSAAASSILGYVMGLGDRHLHNILVDVKSGEVVHIDLGVAFEAGKVLPIPELIPFRLTRDMVDGMGYSKTEGVFRRCCEFTLEALREERESIMTVLNVLRYDPLCTWTVSPLKARKMQDEEGEDDAEAMDEIAEQASKKLDEDTGEAARALAVVERKLTKSLNTTATINELIQQATDERNLALLFGGWSAWV